MNMKGCYSVFLFFFFFAPALPWTRDITLLCFEICSEGSFVHLSFDKQTDCLLNIPLILSLLIFTQSHSSLLRRDSEMHLLRWANHADLHLNPLLWLGSRRQCLYACHHCCWVYDGNAFWHTQGQLWRGEAVDPTQLLLGASVCGRSLGGGRGREPNHDVSPENPRGDEC